MVFLEQVNLTNAAFKFSHKPSNLGNVKKHEKAKYEFSLSLQKEMQTYHYFGLSSVKPILDF
jgi:hypothetical protein